MRAFVKAIIGFVVFAFLLAIITIRPVDRQPYREAKYFKTTLDRLTEYEKKQAPSSKSKLFVGAGKAGITPHVGIPLAGFGARKGAPSIGVHDSLFVRVIALKSGEKMVCLIGFDALLLHPPIARAFEDSAGKRFHLLPEQILYTATHTHSGPGGWGQGFVEEQFAGPPDEHIAGFLIDSSLVATDRALKNMQAASYSTGVISAPDYVRNRLVGDKGKTDPELVYLALQGKDKPIAILATYSAHATVLSDRNMFMSGDYPGYLERRLEQQTGATAILAAAGLGSQSNRGTGNGFDKARNIGEALADSILAHLKPDVFQPQAALSYLRFPIDMHNLQIRISDGLRLAPWLAKKVLRTYDSYMQTVAVDSFLIIGSPGEFSGELALVVKEHAKEKGLTATVTSFNGCYLGYVTPSEYYHLSTYETRLMSFFGPYTGDYFVEIMNRLVDSIGEI